MIWIADVLISYSQNGENQVTKRKNRGKTRGKKIRLFSKCFRSGLIALRSSGCRNVCLRTLRFCTGSTFSLSLRAAFFHVLHAVFAIFFVFADAFSVFDARRCRIECTAVRVSDTFDHDDFSSCILCRCLFLCWCVGFSV